MAIVQYSFCSFFLFFVSVSTVVATEKVLPHDSMVSTTQGVQASQIYNIGLILVLAVLAAATLALLLLVVNKRLQREIAEHKKTELALLQSQEKLSSYAEQTEQFSLSAASIISIKDERILFARISEAIVKFSDYERVLISIFHNTPPYRDLIGYAGVSKEIVDKVRKIDLDRSWYDGVFSQGIFLGNQSYYIPHTLKHILNQAATIYGDGEAPRSPDSWHPEDNLFVKMSGEDGEFIGVISVDTSKSGATPSDEIVRPLEIYAALISQIIILKRNHRQREQLESRLRQAQKMEAIGNLTGGIAHDFNNILGVILGNVDMAIDETPQNSPCAIYLEEIAKAGNRAKNIVRHLLTYSRKTEKKLSPVRIDITLKESISFLHSTLPATIAIVKDIRLNGYSVLADATQIYQIILNLCTNAVHAMKESGTLTIRGSVIQTKSPLRDISAKELPPGDYVKISIEDTGHGIDSSIIGRIFDPYFTTKDVGQGTGMGLAIVHGIVQNHDGAISLHSQPGSGSIFSVYLPVCSSQALPEKDPTLEIVPGTETILIVDDDTGLLAVSRRFLQRLGYSVHAYSDPAAALQSFSQNPEQFDLVISDMTMPQMTGETLVKRILALRSDIPVFLCTGYSNLINETRAKEIGVRGYFDKPIDYPKFAHALRQVFDGSKAFLR